MSKNPIVHIEFSAQDREETSKFYTDLFGWEVQHIPEMNYATFDTGSQPGGGFNPVSESNPAGTILVYVGTDDIDASLAKAEELGGKTTVPKTEVPGFGWMAFFVDPTGNTVGLWTGMTGE